MTIKQLLFSVLVLESICNPIFSNTDLNDLEAWPCTLSFKDGILTTDFDPLLQKINAKVDPEGALSIRERHNLALSVYYKRIKEYEEPFFDRSLKYAKKYRNDYKLGHHPTKFYPDNIQDKPCFYCPKEKVMLLNAENPSQCGDELLINALSREKDLIENRNKRSADREFHEEIIRFQQHANLIEAELAVLNERIAKIQADTALDEAITLNLALNHEQQ